MREIKSIAFFGAGNVACHLALKLIELDIGVTTLVHRNPDRKFDDPVIESLVSLNPQSIFEQDPDLIIVAVQDSAISEVADFLSKVSNKIPTVHTSGGQSSMILSDASNRYGSFYPLQTITATESVQWNEVPFCIYANDEALEDELRVLAGKISEHVHLISDNDRRWLHLAAVMQNNFVNHLMARTSDILAYKDLDAQLLKPLLNETIRKASLKGAREIQTGPARRNDSSTRAIHLDMLREMEDDQLTELYNYFWRSIQAYYDISGESKDN